MADLWMGNLASDASDDEIKAFLIKYGFPPFDGIDHVPGDGSRPAVRLTFNGVSVEALRRLQPKVHDKFWKNHRLNVQVMPEHTD